MFHALGESVSRTIKHKAGVGLVVSPRRYVLDTMLAAAAEQAGADVRYGVTVTGVRRDRRGRVTGIHGYDRAGTGIDNEIPGEPIEEGIAVLRWADARFGMQHPVGTDRAYRAVQHERAGQR